jgi:Domain of unknown function (4846)
MWIKTTAASWLKKTMELLILLITTPFFLHSCNNYENSKTTGTVITNLELENHYKQIKYIPLPDGFERPKADSGSFCGYLRNIGLKPQTTVYLFNGQPKQNQTAQYALLNISVGDKDLQQCADAVMRLRAEYYFEQKAFDKIIFFDNNHTAYRFASPYSRDHFDKYLTRVFGMCGSASLSKQLRPVTNFADIKPGDVLIRGGFPGHAVIVMDVAANAAGKKIYLLAQSYMPAQDIHVLKNPMNDVLSPWYEADSNTAILTPEYKFTQQELMEW